jgi:UDPglucose 6-dehydrogenase
VQYHGSALEAARGADLLVIVTEWDEFRRLDLVRLKRAMATPVLVDLRNIFSEEQVTALGFAYCGIGHRSAWHRPPMPAEKHHTPAIGFPESARSSSRKALTTMKQRGVEAAE